MTCFRLWLQGKLTYMSWVWLLCEQTDDDSSNSSKQCNEEGEVHIVKVLENGRPVIWLPTSTSVVVDKRQDHPNDTSKERQH